MSGPLWWTRPLDENSRGRDVAIVQRKLGMLPTGVGDPALPLVVRGFQKGTGLPATGIVDEETARALGEQEGFGLLPGWWNKRDIGPESPLYQHALDLIGAVDMAGLKRFQGNHRLPPTGVVDETTARLLAGLEVEW